MSGIEDNLVFSNHFNISLLLSLLLKYLTLKDSYLCIFYSKQRLNPDSGKHSSAELLDLIYFLVCYSIFLKKDFSYLFGMKFTAGKFHR